MADFTTFQFQLNTGTQAAPVWTALANSGVGGANEHRHSDSSAQGGTGSASWPYMTRPGATQTVPYQYAFTADAVSLGYLGTSTNTPIAWANTNYNDGRWSWDNLGTFASAPSFTYYASSAHGAITRNDGSILGGSADTTNAGTARSYFKLNAYGSGATTQTPAAAPTNAPVVTDGSTGAATPGAGAWLTNYQSAQGDNDYITYGSTPTATTAQVLYLMLVLFTGPGMNTGTYTPVNSVKYTYA